MTTTKYSARKGTFTRFFRPLCYTGAKMNTIFSFIKGKPLIYGGIIVFLIAGATLVLSGNRGPEEDLLTAVRSDFVQEVSVSGKVIAAQDVDLSFPETGRVASVAVRVGDTVVAGTVLASLAIGTLTSDLQAAEAQVALRRAETQNISDNLEEVRREQDTLVASAYRKLLSEGLDAVPTSSSYAVDPPVVTGLYDGAEGTYRLRIERKVNSGDYELRTFNLEGTEPVEILDDEPTALGTHGLFVSFPDALSGYDGTMWQITIPNTSSSSYLQNYNAHQEALRTRARSIAEAQADVAQSGTGPTVAQAQLQQAEAEAARIRAAIVERTLRAPFAGIITTVDAKVGGIASANAPAISLISAGALQIESFVPEVNIALIEVGDMAAVTLDAYGGDVVFSARVVSIDPAETVRDGVSTYRAILQFKDRDERVRSGMTANVRIMTDRREGVISIPRGVVIERDGKKYVRLKIGNSIEEREVTTGAVSSLGNIEILTGLEEGDVVVLSELQ